MRGLSGFWHPKFDPYSRMEGGSARKSWLNPPEIRALTVINNKDVYRGLTSGELVVVVVQ